MRTAPASESKYFTISFSLNHPFQETAEKFEKLSALGKDELKKFSNTRFEVFQKNLVELGELQVKHSRNRIAILEKLISEVENVNTEL